MPVFRKFRYTIDKKYCQLSYLILFKEYRYMDLANKLLHLILQNECNAISTNGCSQQSEKGRFKNLLKIKIVILTSWMSNVILYNNNNYELNEISLADKIFWNQVKWPETCISSRVLAFLREFPLFHGVVSISCKIILVLVSICTAISVVENWSLCFVIRFVRTFSFLTTQMGMPMLTTITSSLVRNDSSL